MTSQFLMATAIRCNSPRGKATIPSRRSETATKTFRKEIFLRRLESNFPAFSLHIAHFSRYNFFLVNDGSGGCRGWDTDTREQSWRKKFSWTKVVSWCAWPHRENRIGFFLFFFGKHFLGGVWNHKFLPPSSPENRQFFPFECDVVVVVMKLNWWNENVGARAPPSPSSLIYRLHQKRRRLDERKEVKVSRRR